VDEQHVDFLVELAATYFGSEEQREGHLAYQEKRDPNFRRFRRGLDPVEAH
jgi:1,4-dihydroxy-2-naphthoyl-CoA synthase